MQQIPLTFYERIILWNLCGAHQVGSLKEASVYLRLIEKLRPTDEESRETGLRMTEQGLQWSMAKENYGNRVISAEDDEARALKAVLEGQRSVRVSDAQWMLKLTELLAAAEPVPA